MDIKNNKEKLEENTKNILHHNSYWINIPGFIILTLLWLYIMLNKYYS